MSRQTKEQKKAQREQSKEKQKAGRCRYFKDCTEVKVRRTLKSGGLNGVACMKEQALTQKNAELAARIDAVFAKIKKEGGYLARIIQNQLTK